QAGHEQGVLNVNGTFGAPVLFTSQSGTTNGWKGVAFGDASDFTGSNSHLNRLIIEKAGQAQTLNGTVAATLANLIFFNSGLTTTLVNGVIANGSGDGISSFNSAPSIR